VTDAIAFSRLVRVDALPKDGLRQVIEANPAERAALAALNGLPAIARLTADLRLTRAGRGGVRVHGEVLAEATQTCVVTLEPIEAIVREEIDVRFAPPAAVGAARNPGAEEIIAMTDADGPDPIVDGKIDLGALAAEFFALGLDPYPRKPGVAYDPQQEEQPESLPFSALGKREPE